MKIFFKIAFAFSLFCISCQEEQDPVTPLAPPGTNPVAADSLSLTIQKYTDLVKTITSDTSYSNFSGLTETHISYINKQDKKIALHILQIDLNNTGLSLEVATPNNQPATNSTQRVSGMISAKNNSTTDKTVLAGINGDYFTFSSGEPLGPVHQNGVPIKTFMSSGYKFFGYLDNGNYMIGDYTEYQSLQSRLLEVMGGRHLLLDNGQPVAQTDVSVNPRTSIGLINFKKAIILVVDGRQPAHSVGYTLAELASTLQALGVKDAVNLDGGGSSVMITKGKDNLYKIRNKVSDGSERAVANGLFVMKKN